ncbi:MAG: CIA30 family protein [Bacteroidales bacterium]
MKINMVIAFMVILTSLSAQTEEDFVLFDFNSSETSGKWYTVNDDVMGGISESSFLMSEDGLALFSGNVSPENNGGFASARAFVRLNSDSKFKGVIIRVKGDGNKYNIRFRTDTGFDGYAYQAKFQTEKDSWIEYKVPFSDFKPTFRGRTLSNKPILESKNIEQNRCFDCRLPIWFILTGY